MRVELKASRLSTRVPWLLLGSALLVGCSDPFSFDNSRVVVDPQPPDEEEICEASANWLPDTADMDLFNPPPHPEGECPFYRGGWQNFLIATQPDPVTGRPALQSYPTIDTMFQFTSPLPANRSWLGDVKQAGGRQILIDQNGHSLYYGIHANQAFADFVKENELDTPDGVRNADPTLFFPAGMVIFKSAWQEVDPGDPTLSDYISTTATVPHLSQDNSGPNNTRRIVEDRNNPRQVTVRLLALHVVYTLPGHPEFIWATMEHSTGTPDTKAADGHRDVAPIHPGSGNPTSLDPENRKDETVISNDPHLLFRGGTTAQAGNQAIAEAGLIFNETTQRFSQQTSVYRMFPASKSNTVDPDDAISSLNHNVEALFAQAADKKMLSPMDKRGHYRLVGAQWMDKPAFFRLNTNFQNDSSSPLIADPAKEGKGFSQDDERQEALMKGITPLDDLAENGSDSAFSLTAGEDRLSSTAMESFTQGPDAFPNCFSCHNTQAIQAKGVPFLRDPSSPVLLQPKLLNVTHIFAQFLLDDAAAQMESGR
jgi:hypothetical protein